MTQPSSLPTPPAAPGVLQLHPVDDVAVALRPIDEGERIDLGEKDIAAAEALPHGHKIALRDLPAGAEVRKFGWPIGRTKGPIPAGAHVHTHNVETLLSGVEGYRYQPVKGAALAAPAGTYLGYRRADGRVGTRNMNWILPTVGCIALTAQRIASIAGAHHSGKVDGIYAFAHPHGC